jgi:lauroyl/myristoyl acyltransferase
MTASIESSLLDPERRITWEQERHRGVGFDVFMALSNLTRELRPLQAPRSIEDVWFAYRDHVATTNGYREDPQQFPGYTGIEGLEHVTSRIGTGGVILLLHFGDYRHAPLVVASELRKIAKDVPLAMIVDQDSYDSEATLSQWLPMRRAQGLEFMVAENPHIGMQMLRHLRRGGWIYIYLDGNTGAGTDPSPLEIPFLSSRIHLRSGLFRLLARTGSPVIPMLTDRVGGTEPRVMLHPAQHVSADALAESLDTCFEPFRVLLRQRPELWRFWYRHHRQVVQWQPMADQESPIVDWRCNELTPPLGLSLASGRVFRVA